MVPSSAPHRRRQRLPIRTPVAVKARLLAAARTKAEAWRADLASRRPPAVLADLPASLHPGQATAPRETGRARARAGQQLGLSRRAEKEAKAARSAAAADLRGWCPTNSGGIRRGGQPCLKTTVDISQIVFAPVLTLAFGVAPRAGICSSATSSMSGTLETVTRPVHPVPAVSVSPNPESI
jgi:hypothetical protein